LWLQKCELSFRQTGRLDLSGIPESPDLSAIHSRLSMKELNISRTKVTSLDGLAVQPNLQAFHAKGSLLSSFKNFAAVANASIYTLKGTPLSADPDYLIALSLLTNSPRPIVDGKMIPPGIAAKAAAYPPLARDLLNCGWQLVHPCPDPEAMRQLCAQFNVPEPEPKGGAFQQQVKNVLVARGGCAFADGENVDDQIVAAVRLLFVRGRLQ
jgi:hypothetical protein